MLSSLRSFPYKLLAESTELGDGFDVALGLWWWLMARVSWTSIIFPERVKSSLRFGFRTRCSTKSNAWPRVSIFSVTTSELETLGWIRRGFDELLRRRDWGFLSVLIGTSLFVALSPVRYNKFSRLLNLIFTLEKKTEKGNLRNFSFFLSPTSALRAFKQPLAKCKRRAVRALYISEKIHLLSRPQPQTVRDWQT